MKVAEIVGFLMFSILGSIEHPLSLLGAVLGLVIAAGDKIKW